MWIMHSSGVLHEAIRKTLDGNHKNLVNMYKLFFFFKKKKRILDMIVAALNINNTDKNSRYTFGDSLITKNFVDG